MRFETFLRSKVAIRIFVLFVCCALLPIATLAVLSYSQVTKQLSAQNQKRLKQESKEAWRNIAERLYFLEGEMKMTASRLGTQSNPTFRSTTEAPDDPLRKRFKGFVLFTEKGEATHSFGQIRDLPEFTPEQKEHIRSGRALLFAEYHPYLSARIFMSIAVNPQNPGQGILLGEINTHYLWDIEEQTTFPGMIEFCVLDQSNNILFSSLPGPVSFPKQVLQKMKETIMGEFEWANENHQYLASYRSISLHPFMMPKWTVVLSQSKSDALAPVAYFKKIFPLIFLMSLLVVILFSTIQIRRSMIPLEKLREGTRRIAMQDFGSQVTIRSGDEFEELAASFNAMASRLGKQFHILTMMGEIDRAILSSLDTERIIGVVLSRMRDVFPCDIVSVTLLDYDTKMKGRTYIDNGKGDQKRTMETFPPSREEMQILNDHSEGLLVQSDGTPNYLAPLFRSGIKTCLVLPIILKQKLSGFVSLGWQLASHGYGEDDVDRARQLGNQIGVALSNARLLKELNELNWGILETLARAIDAKSPWTAGHSERVTKLALKIGQVMGLTEEEINVLHRGGLLHDIGKLGIPGYILDKRARLTKGEEEVMREHVRLGARILEPIAAFADIIPLVLQHHEGFDGKGYPQGLAGDAIEITARIFAVADSFDALTSTRPYRHALDRAFAIKIIREGADNQYDPRIVQAFMKVMAQEGNLDFQTVGLEPHRAQPETPESTHG